jgi:phenylacetate-CoA ligase
MIARKLQTLRPAYIWSYSGVLYRFAKFLAEERIDGIYPRAIVTSSDMLYPRYRELIERQFRCRVFDNYSSKEFAVASECEHGRYHVYAENVYVELLREGARTETGVANIGVTDLRNYGFPLIRYSTGDVGSRGHGTCACGRGLPTLERIEGRISDFLVTPAGGLISGTNVTAWFKDLKGVKEYQVRQKDRDYFIFSFVPDRDFSDSEIDGFVRRVKQSYLGEAARIEKRVVEMIERPPSGKRQPVVQELVLKI